MQARDYFSFFFFNDTATTEIYTLSLHDALPICPGRTCAGLFDGQSGCAIPKYFYRIWFQNSGLLPGLSEMVKVLDRKSTRLNSSHGYISYAVFCLKKKNNITYSYILTPEHRRTH